MSLLRPGVLFVWLTMLTVPLAGAEAADDLAKPFLGTYVGTAQILDEAGQVLETRDMDITIAEGQRGAFTVTWINVTLVDGRRDVPGVKRRVDTVTLAPGPETGIYLEESRRSLFARRRETDVMKGEPLRWARIDGNRLGMFSLVVLEDGGYSLQSYERILTDIGMDIEFRR
ncbi:MAG: hypothetical protein HKM95_05130, partial [Inquilinus sp.]|nr:hypothetical protein [Inquilinus sp.]